VGGGGLGAGGGGLGGTGFGGSGVGGIGVGGGGLGGTGFGGSGIGGGGLGGGLVSNRETVKPKSPIVPCDSPGAFLDDPNPLNASETMVSINPAPSFRPKPTLPIRAPVCSAFTPNNTAQHMPPHISLIHSSAQACNSQFALGTSCTIRLV